MSIELSDLFDQLETNGDDVIEAKDFCEYMGIKVSDLMTWRHKGVFSATPHIKDLQASDTHPPRHSLPSAVLPALGVVIDFAKVLGAKPDLMTQLWETLVDVFIDTLLYGDLPNCVVITETDMEVLIGDDFEYHFDMGRPFTVIPVRKELLHLGGWSE